MWRRKCGGHRLSFPQEEGRGHAAHRMCERLGPRLFGMALVIDGDRLRLVLRCRSICDVALPIAWAPFGPIYEHEDHGRFCFHVDIGHPLTALIVYYRGWLGPQATASDNARQTPSNPALVDLVVET